MKLVNRPWLWQQAWLTTAIVSMLLLAGLVISGSRDSAQAQVAPLKVGAGVGSGTLNGAVYTPGEITVVIGSSVMWTINSDEPHTITFGQGSQGVPPPFWPNTFNIQPGPPAPVTLSGTYDGTGFVNTGIIFKGSTLTLRFTQPGSFPYFCAIHPGMTGKVNVVAAGQPVTTQAQADAKAIQTASAVLGQEPSLRQQTVAKQTSEARADGTKLWVVPTGPATPPQPFDGGSGYLEIQEFFPVNLTVTQGDTVRWDFPTAHTTTFGAGPPDQRPSPEDPRTQNPAKPSQNYEGTGYFNSGVLGVVPGKVDSFDLTFTKPGTYEYICLLHWPLGMVGTITVQAKPAALSVAQPVQTVKLEADVGSPPAAGWKWAAVEFNTGAGELTDGPHAHDLDWIFFTVKGSTEVSTPDGRRVIPSGEGLLIPSQQQHAHRYAPQSVNCPGFDGG